MTRPITPAPPADVRNPTLSQAWAVYTARSHAGGAPKLMVPEGSGAARAGALLVTACAAFAFLAITTEARADQQPAGAPPAGPPPAPGAAASDPSQPGGAPPAAPPPPASPQRTPPRRDTEEPIPLQSRVPGAASPGPALAEPAPRVRTLSFLYRLTVDFGGDDVVKITSTEGNDKITAGGLAGLSAGLFFHPAGWWTVETTIGYKLNRLTYTNGDAQFSRVPVEVIVSLRDEGFRAGLGGTAHLAPTMRCSVPNVCGFDIVLDTAFGLIAQAAYGFHGGGIFHFDLGLRATAIKYTGAGVRDLKDGSNELDGTSIGFFVGGWL
jgi:hypothetical protein